MHASSFDQAAHLYDETRGFPPGVGDQVAGAALSLLDGRRAVLEIGVGTGRIARPLLARGVSVTGLDVSRKMMARLLAALPAGQPPDLIQGAAEALPLAAASFDAVISVHVFHLLPAWQTGLAELRRVLRPGGIFLSGYEWRPPDAPGARLMAQWRSIVAARSAGQRPPTTGPGSHDFDDIKAALLAGQPRFDEVMVGQWTTTRTLARSLEAIEHRTWSSTWNLPDEFFAACLAELRAWAASAYGPLDREFVTPHRFLWQRFAWPAA